MTPIDPIAPAVTSNGEDCECNNNCALWCSCPGGPFDMIMQRDREYERSRITEQGWTAITS